LVKLVFCVDIVSAATDLYPEEVYSEIKEAFEKGLADERILDLKLVDQKLAQGKERVLAGLEDKRYELMGDTIEKMKWLIGFREEPVVKGRKVDRNEPCPCGSGRKYKKCCGA
jgi:preprotein translocase subunit SecA